MANEMPNTPAFVHFQRMIFPLLAGMEAESGCTIDSVEINRVPDGSRFCYRVDIHATEK